MGRLVGDVQLLILSDCHPAKEKPIRSCKFIQETWKITLFFLKTQNMLAQSVKIFICNKAAVLESFASSRFRNAKVFMPGKKNPKDLILAAKM